MPEHRDRPTLSPSFPSAGATPVPGSAPGYAPGASPESAVAPPSAARSPDTPVARWWRELEERLEERRPAAVLGHDEFLERLRLEKRRADRCGAALSLVLLRTWEEPPADKAARMPQPAHLRAATLMARLRELVRETDLLGLMDSGDCAVLLPDTHAQGRLGFINRIGRALRAAGTPELAMTAATYPDQLFENLDAGREVVPLGSLMLDDTGPAAPAGYPGKRLLDLAGAALALTLLAPLMGAVAVAVALSSPGPVVFRQVRLGRGGAPFVFYKFRTMTHGADDGVHRDFVARLISGGHGAGPAAAELSTGATGTTSFKLQRDPRVTRLGRFLRRTSLDELPQFFNVLRGDMSLVGPRPPIPYEARHYRAWHRRRLLQVKPGITGPWQVAGRSQVPFDEMVRMDLRYIARSSLALDLVLLVRTVGVVLSGRGAR